MVMLWSVHSVSTKNVQSLMTYAASVAFHFLRSRDLAWMRTAMTALHSLPFSCSVTLISSRWRRRHRSNSDNGPAFGSMNLVSTENYCKITLNAPTQTQTQTQTQTHTHTHTHTTTTISETKASTGG